MPPLNTDGQQPGSSGEPAQPINPTPQPTPPPQPQPVQEPTPQPVPQQPLPEQNYQTLVPPYEPARGTSVYDTPPGPQGSKKLFALIVAIILILVVVLVALVYYGMKGGLVFVKGSYNKATLASEIVTGVSKINSTKYTVSLAINSVPKEPGVEAFSNIVHVPTATEQAYKRDQDKVRDVQQILSQLYTAYFKDKKYPAVIPPILGTSANVSLYPYMQIEGGKNFSLTVTFESGATIDALKKYAPGLSVQDKTITFTKSSPTYFYLPTDIQQPAFAEITTIQRELASVPDDTSITLNLDGSAEQTSDKKINTDVHVSGNADISDITIAADLEFKKVGDFEYFILNKFPAFFGNFSQLKGKWIKLSPQDLSQAGFGLSGIGSAPEKTEEQKKLAADELKTVLEIADRDNVLTYDGSPTKEKVNGIQTYKYDLSFSKDKLVQFYKDLTTEMDAKYGKDNFIKFDQQTLDLLQSDEFNQIYDYFHKNTTLSLWSDMQGVPVQLSYVVRMVPVDAQGNAKNREIKAVFTVLLKGTADHITAPSDSITLEDATIAMTGQTKEGYRLSKQTQAVQQIRFALTTYKNVSGSYPLSLDDLKKTYKQVATSGALTSRMYSYWSEDMLNQPIMKSVPVSVNTGQPFEYSSTGTEYKLKYDLVLPAYHAGDAIPYELYTIRPPYGRNNVYVLQYVNGTNTADSKVVSEEANIQGQKDSDGDGLSDDFEKYIGTDIHKKDTDGDGYSDLQEVQMQSNPLGPGRLNSSYPTVGLPTVY